MTTALYRRYRPQTFAEVIGQEHVTAPLMQALRSQRVNHAYLFSGPRGCGKTTSARILARTLNCARNTPESPIDLPCGECASCLDLARNGSGSLDVVEIDAASHGGVDDARDLRERVTFAPTRDRYKIYIIDEAHMVTPQGFNALLKVVEEPPPHVKFIFATTHPDRVLPTIRSRTHHYPFRLVPPEILGAYLTNLAGEEGFELAPGVLAMVLRAGGGSVRDTLSVLDQLVAGSAGETVSYQEAVALLGFTSAALLDDVVDAMAAGDGAAVFRVVDQVISTGHPPSRFAEDLLTRLRDLIVIALTSDASSGLFSGLPADELNRMKAQAARIPIPELSRAADLVSAALGEMAGATSPRLQLEFLAARLVLPRLASIPPPGQGLETGSGGPSRTHPIPADRAVAAGVASTARGASSARSAASADVASAVDGPSSAHGDTVAARASAADVASSARGDSSAHVASSARSATSADGASAVDGPSSAHGASLQSGSGASALTAEQVRRRWPDVTAAISRRMTRAMLETNAPNLLLDGSVLTLGFQAPWMVERLTSPNDKSAVVAALREVFDTELEIRPALSAALSDPPEAAPPSSTEPVTKPGPSVAELDAAWLAGGEEAPQASAAQESPPAPQPPGSAPDPAISEPSDAADYYESGSFDEPDLAAASGAPDRLFPPLVGVAAVVKALDGTIVEEIPTDSDRP